MEQVERLRLKETGWGKFPYPDFENGEGWGEPVPQSEYLMKGRSSARSAFMYHVAWTTTRAHRFFRSLKKKMRSSYFVSHLHA